MVVCALTIFRIATICDIIQGVTTPHCKYRIFYTEVDHPAV